ncbi:MAG TPA: DUF3137 domain-containing protein [Caulobacteraceae bacterium]|nr:DUF3137 domain-containing protein [Caulobacteraceae bacterium]
MTLAVEDQGVAARAARPSADAFGHRLAPAGDPLEGAAFDELYQARIEPELVKREAERKGAVKAFALAIAAGAVLVFLENLMTPSLTGGAAHTVDFRIALATMVVAAVLGYLPISAVAKNAKVGIISALCEPLGVRYSAAGADGPSFGNFLALNLLPKPSDKSFTDFLSGRRAGVDFTICEAVLHQGSGKNRSLVFQGQLFRLVTPRRLASTTVVLRNTGWLKSFECPHGLQSVGLEDAVFNKAFAVFASDQVEAREILTPAFMQQLVDLEAAYAGGHIRCAFAQSELLIALEGPNRFEVGNMFSTLVDRSRVEGIAHDLEQVFKMIDEFAAA